MASINGDIVLSCNGEIYNFIELREELKALGYSFATGNDTEVIIAANQEWGREVSNVLTGCGLLLYMTVDGTSFLFLVIGWALNRFFILGKRMGCFSPLHLR